ncbi:MAG: cell division protein FtsZ [Candidatus Sumerlaeia bacterium]|nr:cell division protein FtsZ [Candidatus Sumerlaeia bacterium]
MPDFVLDGAPSGAVNIKVIGVGGGGCNAVDSVFTRGLSSVEFYVLNSDIQALKRTKCPNRIQIGSERTHGRGCGADPKLGEQCLLDAKELIVETLQSTELVFVTSGMGGGTGTGAAPALAQIAREMGILTVGVVTTPFKFEGPRRAKSALEGIEKMREHCDTLIIVNNNRLLDTVGPRVPLREAFQVADTVLADAVQAISDLIATPCLINLDFNDVRTIMGGRGGAVMGIGVGKGENRAQEAVKKATSSPLLDKLVIDGASGILVCITGGADMTLKEVDEAVTLVTEMADPDVDIIFGAGEDESLTDQMRVTLIATGFKEEMQARRDAEVNRKNQLRRDRGFAEPQRQAPRASIQLPPLDDEIEEPVSAPPPSAAARQQQAPAAPERAQAPQQQQPTMRPAAPAANGNGGNGPGSRPGTLRSTLESMMREQAPAAPAAPARAEAPAEPSIRVAPSGPSRQPVPSQATAYNVRTAPPRQSPAPAAAAVRSASRPAADSDTINIPLFDPANDEKAEEEKGGVNFDIPSFMRKRGLFE